jgi:hypothetical protein
VATIPKCRELCRTYDIGDSFNAFTGFQQSSVVGMIDGKATFRGPATKGPATVQAYLVSLMTYLEKWQFFISKNDAYSVLMGINSVFNTNWASPLCTCGKCTLTFWRAVQAVAKNNEAKTTLLRDLMAQNNGNVLCHVYHLYSSGIGNQATADEILMILHRLRAECHVSTQRISDLMADPVSALRMYKAWKLHPPGQKFPGVRAWGSGDHADPQANLTWHFYKHVCGTGEVREDGLGREIDVAVFPDECAMWWRLLDIRIPESELRRSIVIDHKWQQVEPWLMPYNGVRYLTPAYAEAFIRAGFLTSTLPMWLHRQYIAAYQDLAIRRSKAAEEVVLEIVRMNVFIDCFCEDDVFVVTRYNEAGYFDISSCYILLNPPVKRGRIRASTFWTLEA